MTLTRLARWAHDLRADQVPAAILQRARLQQLSSAGALRAGAALPMASALLRGSATRGKSPLVGTTRHSSRRDSLRYHSALLGALDFGDVVLWASTGPAASAVAWSLVGEHSAQDLDLAIVAANEIAGRVGLAGILAPSSGPAWLSTQACAAAVTAGRLLGLDAQQLAHAIALALGSAGRPLSATMAGRGLATAAAVERGYTAAELAQQGAQGDLELLDRPQGFFQAHGCTHPLPGALEALGQAWISETLLIKSAPGSLFASTATEALTTILDRHIRAADKRLRPDQWVACRIQASWPTWAMQSAATPGLTGLPWNLATLFGVLGRGHALSPEQLSADWFNKELADIETVAATVRVEHHWAYTVQAGLSLLETLAPLMGGLGVKDLQAAARSLAATGPQLGVPVGKDELLALAKVHPRMLLPLLSREGGDLSAVDLSSFSFCLPIDIRLETTRGGFWPEKRVSPLGATNTDWDAAVELTLKKFAGASEEHSARAPELLHFGGAGAELVEQLA